MQAVFLNCWAFGWNIGPKALRLENPRLYFGFSGINGSRFDWALKAWPRGSIYAFCVLIKKTEVSKDLILKLIFKK